MELDGKVNTWFNRKQSIRTKFKHTAKILIGQILCWDKEGGERKTIYSIVKEHGLHIKMLAFKNILKEQWKRNKEIMPTLAFSEFQRGYHTYEQYLCIQIHIQCTYTHKKYNKMFIVKSVCVYVCVSHAIILIVKS